MINLDQVRTLEWKVKQAVQLIVHLRRENDSLRGRLSDTEVRLQELETLVESFKASQSELESGIRSALEELDNLEGESAAPVSVAGSVDSVAYPPVKESFAEDEPAALFERSAHPIEFATDEPSALFERAPHAAPVAAESPISEEAPAQADAERSFEEEFAALAAEEEAAAASLSSEVMEAPDSVELEPEAPEEKGPEQPGLGIF